MGILSNLFKKREKHNKNQTIAKDSTNKDKIALDNKNNGNIEITKGEDNNPTSVKNAILIPREDVCMPFSPDYSKNARIDVIFTHHHPKKYGKAQAIRFSTKTFGKNVTISSWIYKHDFPNLKVVYIPWEWEDKSHIPEGVEKIRY